MALIVCLDTCACTLGSWAPGKLLGLMCLCVFECDCECVRNTDAREQELIREQHDWSRWHWSKLADCQCCFHSITLSHTQTHTHPDPRNSVQLCSELSWHNEMCKLIWRADLCLSLMEFLLMGFARVLELTDWIKWQWVEHVLAELSVILQGQHRVPLWEVWERPFCV